MIPENSRDVRDNENRVMYNDRESVTLLKGDVERPCLRGQEKHEVSVRVSWRKESDGYLKEHACKRDGRERSEQKRDSNI